MSMYLAKRQITFIYLFIYYGIKCQKCSLQTESSGLQYKKYTNSKIHQNVI